MAGLLSRVTKKSEEAKSTTKVKKATIWTADTKVGAAVHDLVALDAQSKALEAKMGLVKGDIKRFASSRFYESIAANGVLPETPMFVQNDDGERVTYVVQDRSHQYAVKPGQREMLNLLLGESVVDGLIFQEVRFAFSRDILAREGVAEVVEKALEKATEQLRKSGVLKDGEELIEAETKDAFKPNTLERVPMICGKDVNQIKSFVEAGGSSFVSYVRA